MSKGRPREFNDEQAWEMRRIYNLNISIESIAFLTLRRERVIHNAVMGLGVYKTSDENHIHYVPPCIRRPPSSMIRLRFREANEWFEEEFRKKFWALDPNQPVKVPLFDYRKTIPLVMKQYWEDLKEMERSYWGHHPNFDEAFKKSFRLVYEDMEKVERLNPGKLSPEEIEKLKEIGKTAKEKYANV